MRFRDELRDPLEKLLKRPAFRRRDPDGVKAVLKDPAKMARLQGMVDEMAGKTKQRGRFRVRTDEAPAGRFQRFFQWLIDNQDSILAFVRAIVAMFGAMEAKATK